MAEVRASPPTPCKPVTEGEQARFSALKIFIGVKERASLLSPPPVLVPLHSRTFTCMGLAWKIRLRKKYCHNAEPTYNLLRRILLVFQGLK